MFAHWGSTKHWYPEPVGERLSAVAGNVMKTGEFAGPPLHTTLIDKTQWYALPTLVYVPVLYENVVVPKRPPFV